MAFVRFGAAGFSLILPLLGAGTVVSALSPTVLLQLCFVAACFHVFAFVSNDLVDLPIDVTEPRRVAFPLVRGVVARSHALAIVLVQVPISFALALSLGSGPRGLAALGSAYVLMSIYNFYGKRTAVPWLTDAVQGLSWASLALFGVYAVDGKPTSLTFVILAYLVIYVQMVNGVHGSIRDLPNDLRHGLRTTAIRMGARVGADGRAIPGEILTAYAIVLQVVLVGLALVPIATTHLEPMVVPRAWLIGIALGSGAVASLLLWVANRSLGDVLDANAVGLLHMVFALVPLLAITFSRLNPWLSGAIAGLFLSPLFTIHSAYPSVSWLRRAIRSRP